MEFHQNGHANGVATYHNGNLASYTTQSSRYENAQIVSPTININKKLPRGVFFHVFSYLDLTSLCRCAEVCQHWRDLVKDGENWKHINLFSFQIAIEGNVIESLSRRAGPFLKSLNLKGCKNIGDNAIRIFAKHCHQIEHLNLRECVDISDGACAALGRHSRKLRSLNLHSCDKLTDSALNCLGNGCKMLEQLDISWNKHVTMEGFAHLCEGCPNMQRLICAGVDRINDDTLALFGRSFANLVVINLLKCVRVTDEGVKKLAEGCPGLESICLSLIPEITDHSLNAIGQFCLNIRSLELSSCSAVTDFGFTQMTRHQQDAHPLQNLDVEDCSQLTDVTLQNFGVNCPNIRDLTLSHCDVTDDGIRTLARSPGAQQNLEVLKLDNCAHVSDASLEALAACSHLRSIDLFDCQLITRPGINSLKRRLPQVYVHAYFAPTTPPLQELRSRRRRCCNIL